MMSPATRHNSLKREFFKKLVMGLQICKSRSKKNDGTMSVLDRRNAIKLSADVAIACARKCSTSWSRALIYNASNGSGNSIGRRLVRQMLGGRLRSNSNKSMVAINTMKWSSSYSIRNHNNNNNKNVSIRLKLSGLRRRAIKSGCARSVAKSLMRKRTEVLKRLVPGGRFMDGISLIEETFDYIVALRAQVDVMRSLVAVPQILNLHGN